MNFNKDIPIKKSIETIKLYRKLGPAFGEILFNIYTDIKNRKLTTGEEVLEAYLDNTSKIFSKKYRVTYPFLCQRNKDNLFFPYEMCISINDCIAHGFTKEAFNTGDVISFDFGLSLRELNPTKDKLLNFDAAFTLEYGRDINEWIKTPLLALQEIEKENPHDTFSLAEKIERRGNHSFLNIVTALTGHGIGSDLHEPPIIHNYTGTYSKDILFDGICFCAEPIYVYKDQKNSSSNIERVCLSEENKWAIYSQSGNPSTHFETMFLVENGSIVDLLEMTKWVI